MASALAAGAVAEPGRPQASYFHRDVAAPLAAGAFPGDLEAALAAILDDATCCRRATPPFAVDNFADAWPSRSGRAEKAFAANVVAHARATPGVAAWRCPSGREAVATGLSPWGLGVANGHHVDHGPHGAAWDFALEDDPEADRAVAGRDDLRDIPPQLYFVHQGQRDIKELHWHAQLPGVLSSTASDSYHIFKPANHGDGPAQ